MISLENIRRPLQSLTPDDLERFFPATVFPGKAVESVQIASAIDPMPNVRYRQSRYFERMKQIRFGQTIFRESIDDYDTYAPVTRRGTHLSSDDDV